MIDKISTAATALQSTGTKEQAKLKEACADFESLFINYMLKSARSSAAASGFTDGSEESKLINGMFDENMAAEIASSGGMGLADILFEQFMANGYLK